MSNIKGLESVRKILSFSVKRNGFDRIFDKVPKIKTFIKISISTKIVLFDLKYEYEQLILQLWL